MFLFVRSGAGLYSKCICAGYSLVGDVIQPYQHLRGVQIIGVQGFRRTRYVGSAIGPMA
jgi:hypothetical protein